MIHAQFEKLVNILAPFIKKQDTKFRDVITVEKNWALYYIDYVKEALPVELAIILEYLLQ